MNRAYYSWERGCETVTLPNGSMPAKFNDQMPVLRRKAHTDIILPFKRVILSTEEYVLLRAIIYSLYGLKNY
jgi:hypothetical protein